MNCAQIVRFMACKATIPDEFTHNQLELLSDLRMILALNYNICKEAEILLTSEHYMKKAINHWRDLYGVVYIC